MSFWMTGMWGRVSLTGTRDQGSVLHVHVVGFVFWVRWFHFQFFRITFSIYRLINVDLNRYHSCIYICKSCEYRYIKKIWGRRGTRKLLQFYLALLQNGSGIVEKVSIWVWRYRSIKFNLWWELWSFYCREVCYF